MHEIKREADEDGRIELALEREGFTTPRVQSFANSESFGAIIMRLEPGETVTLSIDD